MSGHLRIIKIYRQNDESLENTRAYQMGYIIFCNNLNCFEIFMF